jgi:hypothetical protein
MCAHGIFKDLVLGIESPISGRADSTVRQLHKVAGIRKIFFLAGLSTIYELKELRFFGTFPVGRHDRLKNLLHDVTIDGKSAKFLRGNGNDNIKMAHNSFSFMIIK